MESAGLFPAPSVLVCFDDRLLGFHLRAWSLIRTMNRCFRQPLVAAESS
jgi:hypothetical protein